MSLRNAVVTGANRGIGLELCRQLAKDTTYGTIYAVCRQTSPALTALASDEVQPASIIVVPDIEITADHCEQSLQNVFHSNDNERAIPIHVLVHNAGAYGPREPFKDASEMYMSQSLQNINADRMRQAFELNTLAPLRITKALLPNLKHQQQASTMDPRKVIIISSAMGSIADNASGGHYAYRTAKAGVNMVGKSLANDLKNDNIAVGMIHPGFVHTGFGTNDGKDEPQKRSGQYDVDVSVQGVVDAIQLVTMDNTGCFLHGNYGHGVKSMPW